MIERLLTYAILLSVGFMSKTEYNSYLDKLFLENPDNDLLIELEFISSNVGKSISVIKQHGEVTNINSTLFGRLLIDQLKKNYGEHELENFASKAYEIWGLLPGNMGSNEPFHTLTYADDPLSWGDSVQTRKIYEKMFRFYDID